MEADQTRTLSDAILDLVNRSGGGAEAADIIGAIVPEMNTTAYAVRQELQRMKNKGDLDRPRTGFYVIPDSKKSAKRKADSRGDAAIIITNPVTGEPWLELVVELSFVSRIVNPLTMGSNVKGMQLKFKNDLNKD